MTETPTLTAGARYVGTITGTLNGARVYRDVEFTAARTGEPEPFVRDRETTPDQDRVFVVSHPRHPDRHGPRLYVTGSIRPAHTGQHLQGCVSCYAYNDQTKEN